MALCKEYTFSSERLAYRGIVDGDAEVIVTWRSRPENYRNFFEARPITLEEHMCWFEGYMQDQTRYDFMILEGGRPIGTVGLSNITKDSCEVSYMIGDEGARGKGYAPEAINAACDTAFLELGVERVDARIKPDNAASIRCAEKAGMIERERTYSRGRR